MTDEIEIKLWSKQGRMFINTEALEWNDPDHVYNQALEQIKEKGLEGVSPEDFGLVHPLEQRYGHLSRGELYLEIERLKESLSRAFRMGYV